MSVPSADVTCFIVQGNTRAASASRSRPARQGVDQTDRRSLTRAHAGNATTAAIKKHSAPTNVPPLASIPLKSSPSTLTNAPTAEAPKATHPAKLMTVDHQSRLLESHGLLRIGGEGEASAHEEGDGASGIRTPHEAFVCSGRRHEQREDRADVEHDRADRLRRGREPGCAERASSRRVTIPDPTAAAELDESENEEPTMKPQHCAVAVNTISGGTVPARPRDRATVK